MNNICTYFEKQQSFVLTDDESRVVGIIIVPEGNACIDKQIISAIADDTGDEVLTLNADLMINMESSTSEIDFEVDLRDNDGDNYSKTVYLTRTEMYTSIN